VPLQLLYDLLLATQVTGEIQMSAVALLTGAAITVPPTNGGEQVATYFSVLVQNLAYTKLVGIWGHDPATGSWSFTPGFYERSVSGNFEIWRLGEAANFDQFDVEYQVSGNVFWDNNSGYNYSLDGTFGVADAITSAVIGPPVLAGWGPSLRLPGGASPGVDSNGNLHVGVVVQNLAYAKQVGIVYTTNNWQTFQYAFGSYFQSLPPASTPHQVNAETWQIVAPVGVGASGEYAAFYTVEGATYWDNNFGDNCTFDSSYYP